MKPFQDHAQVGHLHVELLDNCQFYRMAGELGLVGLIQAAIDGSGNVHRDRVVTYGSAMAGGDRWARFFREWVALLNKHNIDYVHMTDAISFNGQFERKSAEWGQDRQQRRNELLKDFIAVIRENLRFGGMSTDVSKLPSEKAFKYKKKLLFHQTVQNLLNRIPPQHVISFVCDDEQDAAMDYYRFLANMKQRNQAIAQRIAGICFFNDAVYASLQAADMVAYIVRERVLATMESRPSSVAELDDALLPAASVTSGDVIVTFSDYNDV